MAKNEKDLQAQLAKKKYITVKRAERRLINRLNDLDWEFNTLQPELEQLDVQLTKGELPEFQLVEDTTKDDQDS